MLFSEFTANLTIVWISFHFQIEEDFYWVTEKLVQIANSCCDGKVVSALEGGYQLGGEYTSAFAKSVYSHIQALNHGSNSRSKYSTSKSAIENEEESKVKLQHGLLTKGK